MNNSMAPGLTCGQFPVMNRVLHLAPSTHALQLEVLPDLPWLTCLYYWSGFRFGPHPVPGGSM